MPCTQSWAVFGGAVYARDGCSSELLFVGFLAAVRLRRLFRALAGTFRSSYVVGVLIGFLHRE
ncbi:MAG TPA: hypothetical protein VH196_07705 [Terriglobales bacterium]|nr:hypothetical protein [Terriglobales bacterium]